MGDTDTNIETRVGKLERTTAVQGAEIDSLKTTAGRLADGLDNIGETLAGLRIDFAKATGTNDTRDRWMERVLFVVLGAILAILTKGVITTV